MNDITLVTFDLAGEEVPDMSVGLSDLSEGRCCDVEGKFKVVEEDKGRIRLES